MRKSVKKIERYLRTLPWLGQIIMNEFLPKFLQIVGKNSRYRERFYVQLNSQDIANCAQWD